MSTSQIADLAARISANTAKVNEYYLVHKLPLPSFEVDGPLGSLIPPGAAPEIEAARQAVIFDCQELRILMQGPSQYLSGFAATDLVGMQGITRFGLAHAIPVGGEATFAELAAKAQIGETHMRRLLRLAISQHVFKEVRPGVVGHTAASRLLAEDELLYQWMGFKTEEGWKGAYHTCEAMAKWPDSGEPNETGFALGHEGHAMWDYLSKHPDSLHRFAAMMRFFSRRPGLEPHHVVGGYAWGDLPEGATIVDVGGSHGAISIAIAREFPSVKLIVQDLDEAVIEEARKQRPADVADRVQYTVHDFFTEQPVRGAEVYFFRSIFHNWSDKYCIRILRNLVPALKPGSRIVLDETVIPEPDKVPKQLEHAMRAGGMSMNTLFNSGDREMSEWESIFREADPRFHFRGGHQPPGSGLWIIEVEWRP